MSESIPNFVHNSLSGNGSGGENGGARFALNDSAIKAAQARRHDALPRISRDYQTESQSQARTKPPQQLVHSNASQPNNQADDHQQPRFYRTNLPARNIVKGIEMPSFLENASQAQQMRYVDSILGIKASNSAENIMTSASRGALQPSGADRQPGPSPLQHQHAASLTTEPPSQHTRAVPAPPPNRALPSQELDGSSSTHAFLQLIPENFTSQPRFVPNQVNYYSQKYENIGSIPMAPVEHRSQNSESQPYDHLKLVVNSTPTNEFFKVAASGIGRLVGLLPATDLLDREANTFQAVVVSVMNLTKEANRKVLHAERKLNEKEKEMQALQEEVEGMKRQLNAITLALGATTGGVLPFEKALETIQRYIVEASKRDKWLAGKLSEIDHKLEVLDEASKPHEGKVREEAEQPCEGSSSEPRGSVVTSQACLSSTGKAAQAVERQLAEATDSQGDDIQAKGRSPALQQTEAGTVTQGGPTNHVISETSDNADLLDKRVKSLGFEASADIQEAASRDVSPSGGNEEREPEKHGEEQEQIVTRQEGEEREALVETERYHIRVKEEQDGVEAESGRSLGEDLSNKGAAEEEEEEEEKEQQQQLPTTTMSGDRPSDLSILEKSSPLKGNGMKRKRGLDTTFYIHKGSRIDSIVISDEESDNSHSNDDDNHDDTKRRMKR